VRAPEGVLSTFFQLKQVAFVLSRFELIWNLQNRTASYRKKQFFFGILDLSLDFNSIDENLLTKTITLFLSLVADTLLRIFLKCF